MVLCLRVYLLFALSEIMLVLGSRVYVLVVSPDIMLVMGYVGCSMLYLIRDGKK